MQATRPAELPAVAASSGRPSGASAATAAPLEMAPSGPNSWSVQVGSFVSRPNAERLVHQLKSSGASAYVLTRGSGAKLRYRVRVGPLADRAAAERTVTRLKAAGHAATVVAPGAVG
jgi:DedD protein